MLTAEERDALLYEHMEYAEKEARSFLLAVKRALASDKMVGAAYTGLVQATRTFDPSRGVPFKVHAWEWILDYLTRQVQLEWHEHGKSKAQIGMFDNDTLVKHNAQLAQYGVLGVEESERLRLRPLLSVAVRQDFLEAVKETAV